MARAMARQRCQRGRIALKKTAGGDDGKADDESGGVTGGKEQATVDEQEKDQTAAHSWR